MGAASPVMSGRRSAGEGRSCRRAPWAMVCAPPGGRGRPDSGRDSYDTLSGREREILQLVAEGKTSSQIADELYLSNKTVETHRRNIMLKLHLHTTAELVKYAIREGITSLEG